MQSRTFLLVSREHVPHHVRLVRVQQPGLLGVLDQEAEFFHGVNLTLFRNWRRTRIGRRIQLLDPFIKRISGRVTRANTFSGFAIHKPTASLS